MRVELHADDAARADDRAHALDHVAFDVVVAVRDHRAVQAEQHAVQRQRGTHLAQDFVAHEFIVRAVGGAGRAGGEAAPLDQGEAFRRGAPAGDEQRGGAHARRVVRVLAGAVEHAFLVGGEGGRQRREGVGLGGDGGANRRMGGSPCSGELCVFSEPVSRAGAARHTTRGRIPPALSDDRSRPFADIRTGLMQRLSH